jgi:TrmH family RNA methyltransferase
MQYILQLQNKSGLLCEKRERKMNVITSKDNRLIKHIVKLKEKKYRNEFNEYIIEGAKIVKEAIENKAVIKKIICSENALKSDIINKYLADYLAKMDYVQVPNNIFKIISDVETPQGVLAIVEKNDSTLETDFSEDIVLTLDDIQDPGNLGTIIRTADSVGLKQILISKGTTDAYSMKVIRSTMGAIFRVNIIECNDLCVQMNELKDKGYSLITTSLQAKKSIYDIDFHKKIIVIGNEANGVSQKILDLADEKAIIPMLGKTESLNASVATGVILYEYVRQKISR